MPGPRIQGPHASGVKPIWRAIALGLVVGIGARVFLTREALTSNSPFSVRGDLLPTLDPRLDLQLDQLDFKDEPLGHALPAIAERVGLNLVVVWDRLHVLGINRDAHVTLHLKRVTAANAIEAVLLQVDHNNDLRWSESGGIITIATESSQDIRQMMVRLYDVETILAGNRARAKGLTQQSSEDELRKIIMDTVFPNSWEDNGGTIGVMSYYHPTQTLVINQTAQAHRKIEALLRSLDKAK